MALRRRIGHAIIGLPELAERTGIACSTLAAIEQQTQPATLEQVTRIAEALAESVLEMVTY